MRKHVVSVAGVFLALCCCGCSGDRSPPVAGGSGTATADVDVSGYALATSPGAAIEVIEARKSAEDGEEVTVVGRIGGSKIPWIEGRTAFSIVDRSLKACTDIPGDTCPTPWDYCCQTDKLPTGTVLIKVVDARGELVKADARAIPGVKELSTVVVKGTARRDEAGNLTVTARGVYVQKGA